MYSILTFYLLVPFFFFFNDTATTEIYTLSLHDALPISTPGWRLSARCRSCTNRASSGSTARRARCSVCSWPERRAKRTEEHTPEIQSPLQLLCRPLLLKKKKTHIRNTQRTTLQDQLQRT